MYGKLFEQIQLVIEFADVHVLVATDTRLIYRDSFESYGQIWCTELKSSGDLVWLLNLFSIDELHSLDDLGKVREAA